MRLEYGKGNRHRIWGGLNDERLGERVDPFARNTERIRFRQLVRELGIPHPIKHHVRTDLVDPAGYYASGAAVGELVVIQT